MFERESVSVSVGLYVCERAHVRVSVRVETSECPYLQICRVVL